MNNENKPLILALENAREEIIESINKISNENCLSYYFLEIILKDIYNEVVDRKLIELEQVKKMAEQKVDENGKNES